MIRPNSVLRVSPAFVLMVGVVLACVVWNVAQEKRAKPLPERAVKVVGRVVDTPRETKRQVLFTLYVDEGEMRGKRLRCYVPKDNPIRPELGRRYTFWGKLLPFNDFPTTSGHFSYRRWAQSHSLAAQTFIRWGKLRPAPKHSLPLMVRAEIKAQEVRRNILALFEEEGVSGENFALVAAMAFGDKSALTQDTRDMFTRTGASHLLALSGLHLGILYALLSLLFVRSKHRLVGNILVVATVWMYVFVVGMPASVVRAATMLTLYSLLSLDEAPRGPSANPLFVAVAIILLVSPRTLWDVGFQMSVLAVWAIACVYTPIYRLLPPRTLPRRSLPSSPRSISSSRRSLPSSRRSLSSSPAVGAVGAVLSRCLSWLSRWLSRCLSWPVLGALVRAVWAMVAVSVAAQLGVGPLVVYYFGNFSYVFLLTNLVAVPLVTLLLYAVFLSLVVWWCPPLRHALLWFQHLLTDWLGAALGAIDSMGGVSVSGLNLNEWGVVGMYVGVVGTYVGVVGMYVGVVGMYVGVVGVMVGVRWVSKKLERKRENNLPV